MKQSLLAFIIVFVFTACKKENDIQSFYSQINGKWEYENSSSYPFNNNYQPPGNGRIIVFNADRTFESRSHDTVLSRGTYQLKAQDDCIRRENNIMVTTNNTTFFSGLYIKITGNQLELMTSGCLADGGTTLYRKLP